MNDELIITPKNDGDNVEVSTKQADTASPSIESVRIANMLGVSEMDNSQSDQANFVKDYFYKDGMTDVELLYAVKSVENRLGVLKMGETRLSKIYEYARIRKDIETNQKLLDQL